MIIMKREPALAISQPEKAVEVAAADVRAAAQALRAELLPLEGTALDAEAMQRVITAAKLGLMTASQALLRLQKAQADLDALQRRMEGGWWR